MSRPVDVGTVVLRVLTALILVFILAPIAITVIVSFNPAGFNLPPDGLTLRWYVEALTAPEFTRGMLVSLILGLIAATLANLFGLLASLAIVRNEFPGKAAITLFIMSPLLVPSTILGLALYVFMVRLGFGSGVVPLVIGHTLLVLPFSVRLLTASLQNFDRSMEEAAYNSGAGPVRTVFSVTLPIIRPGLTASFVMCFIISWNDFALSIFLASSDWIPLPIQIYTYIKFQYDAVSAAVVSTVIFLSAAMIVALDRLVGLQAVLGGRR